MHLVSIVTRRCGTDYQTLSLPLLCHQPHQKFGNCEKGTKKFRQVSKPAAIKLDELHSPATATDDTISQDKSASQEAHLLTSEREEEHSEEVQEVEIEEFDEESVLDFQPIKPLESILDEEATIVEAASNAKKEGQSTLLKFTEKNLNVLFRYVIRVSYGSNIQLINKSCQYW